MPILFLDCEGTGLDVTEDRIVEICFVTGDGPARTRRVNPGIPIPAEVTAVHGITDADVADEPPFSSFARSVQAWLDVPGTILCGYSIRKYDVPLLDAELRRAGQRGLRDDAGRITVGEIDLYELWQRMEPRSLVGAAKRFAGFDLSEEAHSAEADATILPAVLRGMIADLDLDPRPEDLCRLSVPDGEVDRDGKFKRDEHGEIVFNFGKTKGYAAKLDVGLLNWMLRKDFSAETKAVASALLEEIDREYELHLERQDRERRELAAEQGDAFASAAMDLEPHEVLDDDDLPF